MNHCDANTPQVDETLCNLCGLCVDACPCGAVTMGEKGPVFSVPEKCRDTLSCDDEGGCSCFYMCEEVCPTGAISCGFEIVSAGECAQESTPLADTVSL